LSVNAGFINLVYMFFGLIEKAISIDFIFCGLPNSEPVLRVKIDIKAATSCQSRVFSLKLLSDWAIASFTQYYKSVWNRFAFT